MQPTLRELLRALRMIVVLALVTGGLYTLVVTGVLTAAAPGRAQGSLVRVHGRVVGSALIGQAFSGPRWFTGRPSATVDPVSGAPDPYNAANSGASNLAADNPALIASVERSLSAFERRYHVGAAQVPTAMVESSASGLDPDIPVTAALEEIPTIALSTGVSPATLRALVRKTAAHPPFGSPGSSYVNVLTLNLALWHLEHRGA